MLFKQHKLLNFTVALKMKMAKDSVIIPEKMEMLLAIKNRLYKYY